MPAEGKNELVLAQNQYAFIQDETKGSVKVHVGPITVTPSGNDKPVRYDIGSRKFVICTLAESIQQNPTAAEGSYIVLENPSDKDASPNPPSGASSAPTDLKIGQKVNIQGPMSFALWPGQIATVVEGHQLRSNEYVIARIYNTEKAKANWPKNSGLPELPKELATGQLLVIKGTDVNFFIPPTGVEVMKDPLTNNTYVRAAITLERLEYCILLDEDGNKRYERGPKVVFPKATEKFVVKAPDSATGQAGEVENPRNKSIKFKAVELNDQMGLYIKVIADYEEVIRAVPKQQPANTKVALADNESVKDGNVVREYKAGDELFITGKDQRLYYPRPEHAIIEYGSEDGKFKRQRYYAIAIPKGEARYVLDKNTGKVEMKKGEAVFLPDPRNQVIVRRVLDQKTVELWYPGNPEAIAYNQNLSSLADVSVNYVQDTNYAAAIDLQRSINRGTRGTSALTGANVTSSAAFGDSVGRGTKFTPPPSVTLNTKYDGPPTVNVWTGYAVQVVDKEGKRRVVKGPNSILLAYDETLEKLSLSSGNPKNTDNLYTTVYLRVDHNKVSDTISVETSDMVNANIKVSYRVNFEGDGDKWFSVENYVKFMTDHCRSLLRAEAKKHTIKELIDKSSEMVRDTILGKKVGQDDSRIGRGFKENGMRIYDIEVLQTTIQDTSVANMLMSAQKTAVQNSLTLTAKLQELEDVKKLEDIQKQLISIKSLTTLKELEIQRSIAAVAHLNGLAEQNDEKARELKAEKDNHAIAKVISEREAEVFARAKAENDEGLRVLDRETEVFIKRMGAADPKLATALQALADQGRLAEVVQAIAPVAMTEQGGIEATLKRLLQGTGLDKTIAGVLGQKSEN